MSRESFRPTLFAGILILLVAALTCAQEEKTVRNTDTLRSAVSQLEATDVAGKPALIQLIHKRTLLSSYSKLQDSLKSDIIVLEKMRAAADASDADTRGEINGELRKLSDESSRVADRMQELRSSLQLAVGTPAPTATLVAAPTASSVAVAESPQIEASFTRPRSSVSLTREDATRIAADATGGESSAAPAAMRRTTIKLCGQVRPASLDDTFKLIESVGGAHRTTSELSRLATKLSNPADPVAKSSLNDDCSSSGITPGIQTKEVVQVLQDFLAELERLDNASNLMDDEKYAKQRLGNSKVSRDTIRKQIEMVNVYRLGRSNVKVSVKTGDDRKDVSLNRDGNYVLDVDANAEHTIWTEGDEGQSQRTWKVGTDDTRVNLFVEDRPVSLLTRAVVGYEQIGASSAKKHQDYFFDLFISKPLPFLQSVDPDFGERLRTWGSIRVASIPQSGTGTIGELTSGFVTNVSGLAVKDAANVFDFQAGFEYRLSGLGTLRPSFDRKTTLKFSGSLIGSFGAITPTDPQDSITVFKVFPDAPGLPPEAKNKEFVAFVSSDRDRFFRQYYFGTRVQAFFFNKFDMPIQRFPAQLDVTVGQNEYVTGGALHGPVVRIDGYFPLPFRGMEFVNLYGTAILKPSAARTGIPLVLQPAPAGTVVPAANVALIEVRQNSRDYYRAGIGIDFIEFTKKLLESLSPKK